MPPVPIDRPLLDAQMNAPLFPPQAPPLFRLPVLTVHMPPGLDVSVRPLTFALGVKPRSTPRISSLTPVVTLPVIATDSVADVGPTSKVYVAAGHPAWPPPQSARVKVPI